VSAAGTPAVGDPVPPLERTITLTSMVAYAGATWDWHRLHYDPEFVAANQLPAPVVDGQVFGALLVEMLQDWLGPECFVQTLEFTFRNLVFAGETVRCSGTVTDVGEGWLAAELRVDVVEPGGTAGRPAVAPAGARVLLGTAEGPGAA
jgi:acyl dehydratase